MRTNNILDPGRLSCTGCGACSIVCPAHCITIRLSAWGFYEPEVKGDRCVACGRCKQVCYKYSEERRSQPGPYHCKPVFAVTNNYLDDFRTVSTIGVAARIAETYCEKGYDVCGVNFDVQTSICKHTLTSSRAGMGKFKGSKYLQSDTSAAFQQAVRSECRTLVFGTPCQIYGLRKAIQLLGIENRFLLVDLFCAGIPTRNLWLAYRSYLQRRFGIDRIHAVSFRDKTQGWHKFSISIQDSEGRDSYKNNLYNDLYLTMYLKKVCLSTSCYACRFRHCEAAADIRLGDFWGERFRSHDDGVELVVILTDVGQKAWECIQPFLRYLSCSEEDVFNSQTIHQIKPFRQYANLMNDLAQPDALLEELFVKYEVKDLSYKGEPLHE